MSDQNLISILMPAYNAGPFIGEAIASILAQTQRNFELIVIDDGSTDASVETVRKYEAADSRVRLIVNESNKGISQSLNIALGKAEGAWIGRMDADDLSVPVRLERMLEAAAKAPEVVLWGSYARAMSCAGRPLHRVALGPTTEEQFLRLKRRCENILVLHGTWLARRDILIASGGYDARFDGLEDFEFLGRIQQFGSLRTLPEELLFYRLHPSNTSSTRVVRQQQLMRFLSARNRARRAGHDLTLEAYLAELDCRPALVKRLAAMTDVGRVHYRNATLYLAEHRYGAAATSAVQALALNPAYTVQRLTGRFLSSTASGTAS